MKTYFVDIDGTLTIETENFGYDVYLNRTPKVDMITKINKLWNSGHQIVLWTSRFEEDREVTELWLKKYNVKYTRLLMDKPQYDYIVDDKAIALL